MNAKSEKENKLITIKNKSPSCFMLIVYLWVQVNIQFPPVCTREQAV